MVDLKKEKESVRQAQDLSAGVERVAVPPELPTVESPRKQENLEVDSWITKIEKKFARIPKGQPGAQDDSVVVQQQGSKQPPVTLPVNQQTMAKGQDAPVETGIRWLVTWAIRQIQMLTKIGRKVRLQDVPEIKK